MKNDTDLNNTPLMIAISETDYENAKNLIRGGADVNIKNRNKETALMMFDLSYISLIFTSNSNCDSNCEIEKVIDIMSFLIDNGADVNHQNKDGQTVFMKYVNHYFQITEFLIEKGAEINITDREGKSPLIYAMYNTGILANARIDDCNDKLYFIELLIDKGAKVNIITKDKMTPLMIASQMKSDKVVNFLIQKGANIDEKDDNGETALLKVFNNTGFGIPRSGATDENIFNTLKVLVDAKADKSIKNTQDKTPFMLAVENNLADAIKLFIINGTNPVEENIDIRSLFEKSLWYNDNFELSTYLLKNKFDINSLDKNKNTPLLSIIQDEYSESIIEFLINNEADIQIENEFGYTPLMLLIRDLEDEENRKIILNLIRESQNINTTLKDDKLITAHTIAIINKKEKFAKILEDRGADTFNTLKYLLANDLYFEKEYFEKKLEAFLEEKIEENVRLYLLESWSYFNQRIDVDKIDKCIFLLEKLKIKIGQNKNSLEYSEGYYSFKQIDEILAEVKQELKNNLHSIDSKTFEDILKNFIDFPINPQNLVKILTNFTIDTPIKYTTHEWRNRVEKKYKNNFDLFITDVKKQLTKMEKELTSLSSNLYKKINDFILSTTPSKESWCSKGDIFIGWSSLDGLKEWVNNGNEPFDFILKEKIDIENVTITTFGKVIELFKNEIEIREDTLQTIFLSHKKELGRKYTINISDNLKGAKFYTDVQEFEASIFEIFKEIEKYSKENMTHHIEVDLHKPTTSYIELSIIHVNSTSNRNSQELLKRIQAKGDSVEVYKVLNNLCDWKIITRHKDENFEIDCFNGIITLLTEESRGFTHIMRFYK